MKCIIEMDMASAGKTDGAELAETLQRAIGVIENADLGPGTRLALRNKSGAVVGKLTIREDRPTKEQREAAKAAKAAPPTAQKANGAGKHAAN